MKVVFLQKVNSLWRKLLSPVMDEFPEVEFITDPHEGSARLPEADIIVGGVPGYQEIARAERLSYIVVPFAGINHLPLELIHRRGIRVSNSHGNAGSVAERTVGLILAFYGKIIEYHEDLRDRAVWHGFWVGRGVDDTWESIEGKRCSILGTGEIGRAVAQLLRPFGVKTIGYKRRPVQTPPDGFDEMAADLDEAMASGEIVVAALPETRRTVGLIDAERLALMEGGVLVNVGRGSTVEERALYEALESGRLRGAALDCWYSYPADDVHADPSAYPFASLRNIVLSPHIGGFTRRSVRLNVEHAVENLAGYLREGTPRFEADPAEAY